MTTKRMTTVLLIDEQPERQTAFLDLLRHQPFELATFAHLDTADQHVRTLEPDLVVFDLSTQFSTKKQICERLLQSDNRGIKFLFMVPLGFPETVFVPQTYLAGYLHKPFFKGDVLGRIHSALYDLYIRKAT